MNVLASKEIKMKFPRPIHIIHYLYTVQNSTYLNFMLLLRFPPL